MNKRIFAFGIFSLAAGSFCLQEVAAAPPVHNEPRHKIALADSAHKHFQELAPEGMKDAVPHFAIFGKEGKFYLGIGGTAKVTVGEDWGTPLSNPNEFITSALEPVTDGSHEQFHMSAEQSSLFVNFVAFPGNKNQVGAYLGINFLNNYVPVLQNAYVKWRGLKAGYDYTAFSDNGALPPSIDYEGPNAATSVTLPTLTYTYSFGKNKAWSVTGGLELPQYSITPNHGTNTVTQGIPDIPVAVKYAWGGGDNYVRAAGVLRNLTYHNRVTDKNVDIAGWGVEFSGTSQIVGGLRGYWTGVYGHGIASYIQDLCGMGMDLMPKGDMLPLKATKTWAGFAGLQYDFSRNVYASATYSHVRNYADRWVNGLSDDEFGGTYKYAQYVLGNVFWKVTPIVTVGMEYIYGRRVNNDGGQLHCNRLQGMVQVAF